MYVLSENKKDMDPFDLRLWNGFAQAGGNTSMPAIVEQIAIDSRRIHGPHALFVALKGEKQDGHQYVEQAARAGAQYALVGFDCKDDIPGLQLLRVENPLKAFQEIALCYRLQMPAKVIGISGSFGKTMVKDLLQSLLSTQLHVAASPESFNSQIGVPLSLLTIRKEHEVAIIEAGISQKTDMDTLADIIRPDFGLLTIIGKKHLTTLDDLSTITTETMKLLLAAPPQNWKLMPSDAILNAVNSQIKPPFYFWDKQQVDLPYATTPNKEWSVPLPYQIHFPNNDIYFGKAMTGYAYFLNLVNMTVKAAWLMGISSANIKDVFDEYKPEPMRTEIWKSSYGPTFVNDTYCSDPQSIDRAIKYFEMATPQQNKIFVFGGMRGHSSYHDNDYKRIGHALAKNPIQSLILYGNKNFKPLVNELSTLTTAPEITICENYPEALSYLKTVIHPNDLVLIKGESKQSLDLITEEFNDSLTNNQCLINLAAVQSNITTLRKALPPKTRVMAVVKALAYGTDDVRMSKFLSTCGIEILGVSYVDEGVALKRAGVQQAIFAINAAPYEATKVAKWELEVGVSDKELIEALGEQALQLNKQLKVHLHINTGMGRFGCRPEEALELAQFIGQFPHLTLDGVMTHFASAEDPSQDAFTREQIRLFDNSIATLKAHGIEPKWIHAGNSATALRFKLPQYNMVRVGLAIYGLYSSEASKKALDLRLALSLTSRIVGINICKKGETVSYGRSYKVERDMQKIAVLPIGYFDGLHRNYSGKCHVLIRGRKAPMVGKICMDYMMVDVTDIPEVDVGDNVLIFGEDEFGQYLSPEELASSGDSIVHELVTCLGPRIQRVFVYEEGKQVR